MKNLIQKYDALTAKYKAGDDSVMEEMGRVWWELTRAYGVRPDGTKYEG